MSASLLASNWLAVAIESLGWTLVHFLWQGTVAWLAFKLFLGLARNASPQVRYLAGCTVLTLMCSAAGATLLQQVTATQQRLHESLTVRTNAVRTDMAPANLNRPRGARPDTSIVTVNDKIPQVREHATPATVLVLRSTTEQTESPQRDSSVLTVSFWKALPQTAAGWAKRLEPWLPWVVALWAAGVAFFSLRLVAGWQTVRGLHGADGRGTDERWIERFSRLQARLGVSYPVRLVFSTSAKAPMVIGWLKPAVLVPAGLVVGLSISQLEAILAHELIHIRRHDYLINLLQNVVETLFFYHPAVAWVSARIRVEREHCCDDAASLTCGGTLDYARALAALAELRRAPALGVAANGGSLVERIRRLVEAAIVPTHRGASTALPTLFLLLAAVGTVGTIACVMLVQQAAAATETKSPAAKAPFAIPAKTKASSSAGQSNDVVTLRGQVLRPDGQPAAGARVTVRRNYWNRGVAWLPVAVATAHANGKFELSYSPSQHVDEVGSDVKYATIAAQAEGFGVQWANVQDVIGSKPLVLKLVPEVPIRGRIVDLEGKPIASVNVRLLYVREPKEKEDLGPWLDAIKSGAMINGQTQKFGRSVSGVDDEAQRPVTTDLDGRFTFGGIGAERNVCLEFRGELIAYRQIDIATRDMKPLKRQIWFYAGVDRPPISDQVFGVNFTFEAAPTKPITGTVRDRATGKPLSGIRVESEHLAGMIVHPHNALETKTDAAGHFRLIGMPKGNGEDMSGRNVIRIAPDDNQPYFTRNLDVPDSPGVATVTLDVDLARGQWITGRVTDQVTGKPVFARVNYFPYLDNPNAKPPEFRADIFGGGEEGRFHTRPDGSYRVLGLPGRAIVGVWAPQASYRKGVGASQIAGKNKDGAFRTYPHPFQANARLLNALKEVNAAAGSQSATCDFTLDPGSSIRVSLVDHSGKPVSGCTVLGQQGTDSGVPIGSAFEIKELAPHEKREVAIFHRERQIGKYFVLNGDEKLPSTMTVTLEPCATLVGRLVDEDGAPFQGVEVQAAPTPGTYPYFFIPIVVSKADGKFECRYLFPGCDYALAVHGSEVKVQFPLRKIAVEPGKTIDLADVKLKRRPVE
jgi:beta-lactamase regulating signal transducer with metallopeptidase domain